VNRLIRKLTLQKDNSNKSRFPIRNHPDQSPSTSADTLRENRPSPNFVTNFLIPAWNIAFGHDELRERYLSLKPKRQHD
jgi:hypothetical protein